MGDLFRGCHKLKRTDENIQKCARTLGANRRQSIHKVSRKSGLSYGTVQRILHHDLELSKHAAKLVPHDLNNQNKRDRLDFAQHLLDEYNNDPHCLDWVMTMDKSWFCVNDPRSKFESMEWLQKNENRGQTVRKQASVKKVMFIPFSDSSGPVHWEYFHNMTVSKEVFLPLIQRVRNSLRARRSQEVWENRDQYLLHMDNAPPTRPTLYSTTWYQSPGKGYVILHIR